MHRSARLLMRLVRPFASSEPSQGCHAVAQEMDDLKGLRRMRQVLHPAGEVGCAHSLGFERDSTEGEDGSGGKQADGDGTGDEDVVAAERPEAGDGTAPAAATVAPVQDAAGKQRSPSPAAGPGSALNCQHDGMCKRTVIIQKSPFEPLLHLICSVDIFLEMIKMCLTKRKETKLPMTATKLALRPTAMLRWQQSRSLPPRTLHVSSTPGPGRRTATLTSCVQFQYEE